MFEEYKIAPLIFTGILLFVLFGSVFFGSILGFFIEAKRNKAKSLKSKDINKTP